MKVEKQEKENNQPILFYGKTDPQYYFFSNFYPSPFKLGGYTYQTNQHYFQSKKFQNTPLELQIIQSKDPKTAKALAKKYKGQRKEQWAEIKEKIMLLGLRAKFEQNKELYDKFMDTGNRELREHTSRDKYWGDGGKKGDGKSRLGVLLMQLREEFRKQKKQ